MYMVTYRRPVQPVRPGGSRTAGHPRPGPKVGWVPMASMDMSLIPCMPGTILPPSWDAYKCVLCDSGVIMFFRKDPAQSQTERRRNADPGIKTSPALGSGRGGRSREPGSGPARAQTPGPGRPARTAPNASNVLYEYVLGLGRGGCATCQSQ